MTKAKKPSKKAAKPKTATAKTKRKLPPNEVLDVTNPQDLNFYLMAERIKAGEYIPAETLALAMKVNYYYGPEMPVEVLNYYHDFLLGKIKNRRGRKALNKRERYSRVELDEKLAVEMYRQMCAEIKLARKKQGFQRIRTDSQKAKYESPSLEAAAWVVNNPLKNRNIAPNSFIRNIVPKYPVTKK